jgi:hypothetical protein
LILLQEQWQQEKLSQVVHLYFDTLHLSNRHSNRVEVAKALANILIRLRTLELTIEKSSPHRLSIGQSSIVNVKTYWVRYYTLADNLYEVERLRNDHQKWILAVKSEYNLESRMS